MASRQTHQDVFDAQPLFPWCHEGSHSPGLRVEQQCTPLGAAVRIKEADAWARQVAAADQCQMPTLDPRSVLRSVLPGPMSLFQVPAHVHPGTRGHAQTCTLSPLLARGQSGAGREGEAGLPVTCSAWKDCPITKPPARQGSWSRRLGTWAQPPPPAEELPGAGADNSPGLTRSLRGRAGRLLTPEAAILGEGGHCLGITLAPSGWPTIRTSG